MYYAEDYIDFIKDVETLSKEIKNFETDNEEFKKIKSFLEQLAEHHIVLANCAALQAGVDTY